MHRLCLSRSIATLGALTSESSPRMLTATRAICIHDGDLSRARGGKDSRVGGLRRGEKQRGGSSGQGES